MKYSKQSTVLLVDDNSANLALLIDVLLLEGFQLMVAESGESALKRVEHSFPDIILLDVQMPDMDGYETCRRLKLIPELANVPIIFLTVLEELHDKQQGFLAGGVDFITQPVDNAELVLRIRTHLLQHDLQHQLEGNNAELEQRVREHTQRLEEEIAQHKKSEQEKMTLLNVVRAQSDQLQQMTEQVVNVRLQQRMLLADEIDSEIVQSVALANAHLDTLIGETVDNNLHGHLAIVSKLLQQTEDLLRSMAENLLRIEPAEAILKANLLQKLSPREREVLILMTNKYSSKKIAELLHLTTSTVRTYRHRIMQKLNVNTIDQLVAVVGDHHLGDL